MTVNTVAHVLYTLAQVDALSSYFQFDIKSRGGNEHNENIFESVNALAKARGETWPNLDSLQKYDMIFITNAVHCGRNAFSLHVQTAIRLLSERGVLVYECKSADDNSGHVEDRFKVYVPLVEARCDPRQFAATLLDVQRECAIIMPNKPSRPYNQRNLSRFSTKEYILANQDRLLNQTTLSAFSNLMQFF